MIVAADLFCGAGGTSTGLVQAAEILGHQTKLTAVNHWDVAVSTHSVNHPNARHYCESIDDISPRKLFSENELDILWASPECTHHSIARGGRPVNDQSRATAWCVVRWAEALRPGIILIENVPEFLSWGGIGVNGRPLKSKKGETFRAWVAALESLGYKVGWKMLCAADYGDPTTRKRLFVQAVRGKRKILWPNPTHAKCTEGLFTLKDWVPAREIIDWNLPSKSIFKRKKPLAEKTMARIIAGLKKYGLKEIIVEWDNQSSSSGFRDIDSPLSTVVTKARHGVVEPFIVELINNATTRGLDEPLTTVRTSGGHHALCQPFLTSYYGNGEALSIDEPLDTVTTKQRFGLAQPEFSIDGKKYRLDIKFRMLQPEELAAAQGFMPDHYFSGTKTEAVKQIGNAVPRRLARAICLASMAQTNDIAPLLNNRKEAV